MRSPLRTLFASLALAALAACGGGGGGSGAGPSGSQTASFAAGVMTKGSVIVNGVRYDDRNATVIVDDSSVPLSALQNGMVVKVKGTISDDGVNGVAQRVEIENELRGTVTAIDTGVSPPRFTVGGVTVQTDEATVFANVAGVGALLGQKVEVHGLRSGNTIRASRVEVQNGSGLVDEFKGPIAAIGAGSFTVGGVTVTPAGDASYTPAGCSFAALTVGRIVEVHGGFSGPNAFAAARIECEDLEDGRNGMQPVAGPRNKIEGFVTGLASSDGNQSGSFRINGITVNFSAATQFRRGSRADLADNVRVEAEGTLEGSTLTAREISFKQDRVILQGTIANAGGSTFTVLGQTVTRNSLTEIDDVTVADGNRAEVRARFVDGVLIADEIRAAGGGGSGTREIVQARVTARSDTTVTLLGVEYSFATGAQFRDSRGATEVAITREQFFAAITASANGGTLVKLRGEPFGSGSPRLASQGELEN